MPEESIEPGDHGLEVVESNVETIDFRSQMVEFISRSRESNHDDDSQDQDRVPHGTLRVWSSLTTHFTILGVGKGSGTVMPKR
jgi:hypothetical protein